MLEGLKSKSKTRCAFQRSRNRERTAYLNLEEILEEWAPAKKHSVLALWRVVKASGKLWEWCPRASSIKVPHLPVFPASKFDVRARMLGILRVTRVANQGNALTMQQALSEEVILDHVLVMNKDVSDTQNSLQIESL